MKKKLTIDEQIEDLKKKGVTFEIMSEEEAKKFLRYNNYYFKLKSYGKITTSTTPPKRRAISKFSIFLICKNYLHWICIYAKQ